jgi:hypothetical protein
VATGVEAFRWCPTAGASPSCPGSGRNSPGGKAQARPHKAFKERKETGYATGEAQYRYWDHNLPMGRVPHLHLLELARGGRRPAVRDLFEGTPYELPRSRPGRQASMSRPTAAHRLRLRPGAGEARGTAAGAGRDGPAQRAACASSAQDAGWDFSARRATARTATASPSSPATRASSTPCPTSWPCWDRESGRWEVVSAEWDHEVHAPLHWEDDGQALLFMAEQQGRRPLWRFDLPDRRAERVVEGGWLQGFDKRRRHAGDAGRRHRASGRLTAHLPGQPPRRIERFNDELLRH